MTNSTDSPSEEAETAAAESSMLRDPAEQEISPLELIFDVVFVLAVAQLAHDLVRNPTWRGAAETATLYVAVFSVWLATSWAATLYAPDHPRTRRMMISIMVAGLFMNVAITRAFDGGAWLFVTTYLGIQIGRTAWMLRTDLDETNQDHYTRALVWRVATAPLWIAGAALNPNARLALWAVAAAIDLLGQTVAHPLFGRRLNSEAVPFAAEHLGERCRLFLLIALGETVLTPGSALVYAPLTAITLLCGATAILSTLCLWWIYFRAEPIAFKHLADTEDPIYGARMASNGIMLSVAGLIVLAAGNALVIHDPSTTVSSASMLMLFGGPVLFLLAQVWYLWRVFGVVASPQLATITALLVGGAVALLLPAVLASLVVLAILAGLAITDAYRGSIAASGEH